MNSKKKESAGEPGRRNVCSPEEMFNFLRYRLAAAAVSENNEVRERESEKEREERKPKSRRDVSEPPMCAESMDVGEKTGMERTRRCLTADGFGAS